MARHAYNVVPLTADRRRECEDRLAQKCAAMEIADREKNKFLDDLQIQRTSYMKAWRKQRKADNEEVARLSMMLSTGKEHVLKSDRQMDWVEDEAPRPGRRLREDDKRLEFPPKDEGGEAA